MVPAAVFPTSVGAPGEIPADNTVHLNHRRDFQETRRTGGSVWTNPAKGSAWRLVEEAGAQGLRVDLQKEVARLKAGVPSAADMEQALNEQIESLTRQLRAVRDEASQRETRLQDVLKENESLKAGR